MSHVLYNVTYKHISAHITHYIYANLHSGTIVAMPTIDLPQLLTRHQWWALAHYLLRTSGDGHPYI